MSFHFVPWIGFSKPLTLLKLYEKLCVSMQILKAVCNFINIKIILLCFQADKKTLNEESGDN